MDDKTLDTLVKIIKDEVSQPIKDLDIKFTGLFENMSGRLEAVEQEQVAQGAVLNRVEKDVRGLKEDVRVLKEDVQELKDTTNRIEGRLSGVEKKVA